jgi:hypothetical protein
MKKLIVLGIFATLLTGVCFAQRTARGGGNAIGISPNARGMSGHMGMPVDTMGRPNARAVLPHGWGGVDPNAMGIPDDARRVAPDVRGNVAPNVGGRVAPNAMGIPRNARRVAPDVRGNVAPNASGTVAPNASGTVAPNVGSTVAANTGTAVGASAISVHARPNARGQTVSPNVDPEVSAVAVMPNAGVKTAPNVNKTAPDAR